MKMPIPVIDIFAGPGGLGEGFASFTTPIGESGFRISLSIEKDSVAHQTLLLRAFYRQFRRGSVPSLYYDHVRGEVDRETLFKRYPKQTTNAKREAWHQELRRASHDRVKRRIKGSLGQEKTWVLIGGPPCQAYSLAGRSRMRKIKGKSTKRDHRHYLYREYLRIIADHNPPVFVMENVKGLLSSTTGKKGNRIFERIYRDLQDPRKAIYGKHKAGAEQLTYKIFPLVKTVKRASKFEPSDYVIRSERFGVPQCRHRVILLGVRSDLGIVPRKLATRNEITPVQEVIADLPKLRSALSKGLDSPNEWINTLRSLGKRKWFSQLSGVAGMPLKIKLTSVLKNLGRQKLDTGGEFVQSRIRVKRNRLWYYDNELKGVCNHSARSHIAKDLHRYFFASCFAKVFRRSPTLKDFPQILLPKHKNAKRARKESLFSDRFRVQVATKPSSTITSHISKDGHYFIHPDPYQCRSLTVREAARLQTFPDSYFFAGPRTSQYQQVGNAVPPYLARQIARIVFELFERAK
jgi:DNA (cytosine-5)-methyltransferase 1